MCIGALSVEMAAGRKGRLFSCPDHLVVELGGGYNCVMTVKEERIVNGIGGTLSPGQAKKRPGDGW